MRNKIFKALAGLPAFKGKHRCIGLARKLSQSPLVCRVKHGFLMELDSFDWAQLELLENRNTEPITMSLITETLREGDLFVDVGANIGFTSLVGREAVGGSGKVIAFEPQPYCCERLMRNWEINAYENIFLHVCAIGDVDGFIDFAQQPQTDKSKLSVVHKNSSNLKIKFRVPICTLDSIFSDAADQKIRLLKIDVEGYEISAFHGAKKVLSNIDNIIFEALTHDAESKLHVEKCVAFLRNQGFSICDVRGVAWGVGDEIVENNLWARR